MLKLILAHKLLLLAAVGGAGAVVVAKKRKETAGLLALASGTTSSLANTPSSPQATYSGDVPRAGINDELPTFTTLATQPDNSQMRIHAIEASDAGPPKGGAQGGVFGGNAGRFTNGADAPIEPPDAPSSPTVARPALPPAPTLRPSVPVAPPRARPVLPPIGFNRPRPPPAPASVPKAPPPARPILVKPVKFGKVS